MYKFNNHNIITGYIKELLSSFNLPQCHVLTPGIKVFPNNDYIYKNKVYKFVGTSSEIMPTDLSVLPLTMKEVKNYFYGQHILNITKNLNVSDILYDTYTHEYLGDYLRFHRDYVGVNLMSMYNCFSNNTSKLLNIQTDKFSFDSSADDSKIYVIPVKFFHDYTIGIDCDATVEMCCGFYNNGLVTFEQTQFHKNTYIKKIGTRFKKPFLFSKLNELSSITDSQYSRENNLVLFLKIPFYCESSITVLEGDYTSSCEHYFDDGIEKLSNVPVLYRRIDEEMNIDEEMTNYTYVTKLQLLQMNSNVSIPFADRLVEYLFKNVVNSSDDIGENIKRVQDILIDNNSLLTINKYGEWSDDIRKALFANEISLGLIHKTFDSIGYYDRDLEEALGE